MKSTMEETSRKVENEGLDAMGACSFKESIREGLMKR